MNAWSKPCDGLISKRYSCALVPCHITSTCTAHHVTETLILSLHNWDRLWSVIKITGTHL